MKTKSCTERLERPTAWALAVAAGSLCFLAPAAAQEDTAGSGIETVLVTAQRQSQDIQGVPIAVSNFSQAELTSRQITGVEDLQVHIPDFTFSDTDYGMSNIAIRGIGRTVLSDSADSGVATHIDGAYIESGSDADYYDLERIEILRGPQGTLYGRNTTAGAVNIITHKPDFEYGAGLEAEYANYNGKRVEGFVNVPISDTLAARIAGRYYYRSGYTTNLATGDNIDGRNEYSLRGSLLWQPASTTDVQLTASISAEDSSRADVVKQLCHRDPVGNYGCLPDRLGYDVPNGLGTLDGLLAQESGLVPPGTDILAGAVNSHDLREVDADFDPHMSGHSMIVILNAEHQMGDFHLSAISSFSKGAGKAIADPLLISSPLAFSAGQTAPLSQLLGSPLGALAGDTFGEFDRAVSRQEGISANRQYTEELHLSSSFDGPVNFFLGAFYTKVRRHSTLAIDSSAAEFVASLLGVYPPFYLLESKSGLESEALFGELYYKPTSDLKLTIGLRQSRDRKQSIDRQSFLSIPIGLPLDPPRDAAATFNATTGRVVADWTPSVRWTDQTMVYASYARGARSGGFNPAVDPALFPNTPIAFKPESIDAFEVGTKNTLLDDTMTANLSAFHYNYMGLQISVPKDRTEIVENVPAKISGLEAEFEYQPTTALAFNLALSYLDTRLGQKSIIDPRDPSGGDPAYTVIKDTDTAANCVAPTAVAAALPDGPFGSCATLPGASEGVPVSVKGDELPNAPPFTVSAGIEYTLALPGELSLVSRLDYYRRSESYARVFNRSIDRIGAWDTINAQVQLNGQDERWYLRLFVKNLLDGDAITGLSVSDATSGLATNVFMMEPRQFGIVAGVKF